MVDTRQSLRRLLDDITDVHRKDIKDATSGHLNEGKLYLPAQSMGVRSWNSAKKPAVWLRQKWDLKDYPTRAGDVPPAEKISSDMKKALSEFASGPTAPLIAEDRSLSKLSNSSCTDPNIEVSPDTRGAAKLPTSKKPLPEINRGGAWRPLSTDPTSTHLSLPTKRDQYRKLKQAGKDDSSGGVKVNAKKSIANIESRLNKTLHKLEHQGITANVPSFYRLQAYGDCWERLCKYSTEHGDSLNKIKESYDAYVNALLDAQISSKQPLHDNIHMLDEHAEKSRTCVKSEEENVNKKKLMVMEKLRENERLREELVQEKEIDAQELEKQNKEDVMSIEMENEKPKDLDEQVQELHSKIEEQLYEIQRLRADEKESHVPVAVCQRLEQCLKETEVDIQKICKQNEYLEQSIEQQEEELEEMLARTGVKDKDIRLLWKKVNTSRFFPSKMVIN